MCSSGTPIQELLAMGIKEINSNGMKLGVFMNGLYRTDSFHVGLPNFSHKPIFCALTRQSSIYYKARS